MLKIPLHIYIYIHTHTSPICYPRGNRTWWKHQNNTQDRETKSRLCVNSTAQRHTYISSARDISYFLFSMELSGLIPSPNSEAGPFVFVSTLMSSWESEASCRSSEFRLFFSEHSNDWAHILVFRFVLLPTAGSPFEVSAAALQMSLETQNEISLHAGSSIVNRVMIHAELISSIIFIACQGKMDCLEIRL